MSEGGFTLVEVMVAAMLLVVGLLGTLKALEGGMRLTATSEDHQQAIAVAQGAVERMASHGWRAIALTGYPAAEADATPGDPSPSTPAAYVDAANRTLRVLRDPSVRTSGPAEGVPVVGEPFVVNATGAIPPARERIQVGDRAGWMYRYVTKPTLPCVGTGSARRCPKDDPADPEDDPAKRVTVAIVLDAGRGRPAGKPIWSSTVLSNPALSVVAG